MFNFPTKTFFREGNFSQQVEDIASPSFYVISFISILQMNKEKYHIMGDLSRLKMKMTDSRWLEL